jgi:hypothetical protein
MELFIVIFQACFVPSEIPPLNIFSCKSINSHKKEITFMTENKNPMTPAALQPQKFDSTDLILLAHDEWKRREERKHNHPEDHWVAGFLSGFCTSRTWARKYVDKLRKRDAP